MSGLHCDQVVELVTAYLEGSLSRAERARVLDHLAACDGCESYFAQHRLTIEALSRLPRASLAARDRDALLEAFRAARR